MSSAGISDHLQTLASVEYSRKKWLRSYHVLLFFALIIAVLPFYFWTQSIGFVISNISVILVDKVYLRMLVLFLLLLWVLYFTFDRVLWKKYLILAHICITLLGIAVIVGEGKWLLEPDQTNVPQYMLIRTLLNGDVRILDLISWKSIVFLTAQLIFVANIVLGIIQRKRKRHLDLPPV